MTGSNGVLVKAYTRYTRRYTHGRVSEGSGALYIGRQRLSLSLTSRKNSLLSTRSILGQPINFNRYYALLDGKFSIKRIVFEILEEEGFEFNLETIVYGSKRRIKDDAMSYCENLDRKENNKISNF